MKVQQPAEGILLHKDYGDAKVYKITCDCGADDHRHNLWIEASKYDVTVTIYTSQKTNWWSKTRWHHIWTLLTKGYIETESTVILSEQQALNYTGILQSAVKDVKQFRNNKNEQN